MPSVLGDLPDLEVSFGKWWGQNGIVILYMRGTLNKSEIFTNLSSRYSYELWQSCKCLLEITHYANFQNIETVMISVYWFKILTETCKILRSFDKLRKTLCKKLNKYIKLIIITYIYIYNIRPRIPGRLAEICDNSQWGSWCWPENHLNLNFIV